MRPDTADRSLAHWSEAGRAGMEAFYALAREDYRQLALARDYPAWLGGVRARRGVASDAPLRLLDVACGSGKFPEALLQHAGLDREASIDCALLDPSPFSLDEAARVLRPPFAEGARFRVALEDLDDAAGPFDVVWATHALYALEPDALDRGIARLLAAIAPGGAGLIAQGSADGHYLRFYRAFLDGLRDGAGTPYTSSEQIVAALRAAGATPEVRRLAYDHVVSADDREVLEGYLQRCAFDDEHPLDELLRAPVLGRYLASCHDPGAGVYRFHQEVDLILL